jgi:O-antigen/teichoic acid export membrane protein
MENVSRVQRWYIPIIRRAKPGRPILFAGLGLVAILAGLAVFNPLIGIASTLMLLLLVVVLPRPVLIVYGLALILPLVGGLARGGVIPFLRVGQALLVLGCILFTLAAPSRQGKTRLTVIDLAFVIYFLTDSVLPVLALFLRGEHLDFSSANVFTGVTPLQTLLGPLQYYALYRIVVACVSSEKQIKTILNLSFIASILVSLIGLLQKAGFGPVTSFLNAYYPTVDLGYTVSDLQLRITSTLDSYSGLAAYLAFTIILALACYTIQKHLKFSPLLLGTTILFDSLALALTGTFAASVGLAIGALIVFVVMRRMPRVVIYALIGMGLALIIFQPFFADRISGWLGVGGQEALPTYGYRIMLWEQIFLPAIFQHIWFGAGPAPAVSQLWPSEETQYFALLLRGGILDLLSYIVLMGVAIATCWRQIKRERANLSASLLVAVSTLAILVAINIMNVSADYFSYVGGTQTLWILLAICVASGQFGTLEAATTRRPPLNGGGAMRPAPGGSPVENQGTGQRQSFGPYIVVPRRKPGAGTLSLFREQFSRLKRILDWRFVKDSVVVGAGFTISRVLGLLFMALLAHFLLPDSFGFFRYALGLISVVLIVSTSYPVSITRFLAASPHDLQARDRYFTNGVFSIALLLVGSLLVSIPILWVLHALDAVLIFCILCLAIFYGYFYIVRGLGSAWKMSLTNALSNVVLLAALFIVIVFLKMRTVTVALALYSLADVVPIFLLEIVRPMSPRFRPHLISKAVLLELARFAVPIVIATGTYTIWYEIDVLLIGNFDPHMAGSYAAAKTLAQAFIIVPSAVTMVLMPKVAASDPKKSKRYAVGVVLMALVLCLFGLAFVGIWGKTLIAFTFGARYRDAYLPLLMLSAGMSFYSVYILLEAIVIGRGKPGLAVRALGAALVSTGVIGFWLTPRLGMLGASLSFTVGAILGAVIMLFNTWSLLRAESKNRDPSV